MMIQREQLKHLSSAIQITPGIPQGLIMGPILFLLDLEIGVPQGDVIGPQVIHLKYLIEPLSTPNWLDYQTPR